jgi:hypothetical protein
VSRSWQLLSSPPPFGDVQQIDVAVLPTHEDSQSASRFYLKQTRGPQLLPDVEVEVEFHARLLGVDRVGDFHFDQVDIELPCRALAAPGTGADPRGDQAC